MTPQQRHSSLFSIPIYGAYIVMFGTASLDKFLGGETPAWFLQKFEPTILNLGPTALKLQFWSIATMEAALTLAFIASFALGEFKPGRSRPVLTHSLLASSFLFVILLMGLRLSHDYSGAADAFLYMFISLALHQKVRRTFLRASVSWM